MRWQNLMSRQRRIGQAFQPENKISRMHRKVKITVPTKLFHHVMDVRMDEILQWAINLLNSGGIVLAFDECFVLSKITYLTY